MNRFFNPWIGDNYWDGIGNQDYCVLVLGASVYCTYDGNHAYKGKKKERCPYFEECTSEYTKDSSPFNNLCPHPEWDSNGEATPLEDYPIYVSSGTTSRFGNKMKSRFGEILDGDSIWDHIAFTEYVQYFLNHKDTFCDDLSDRDLDAFIETIDELRPDIVIVWGNVVANVLRESQYAIGADDDEPWDFAWKYDDMFIRFICCTHPASGNFINNFPEFANRFEESINFTEDSDNDEDDEDDDEEDYNDDEDNDDEDDEEEDYNDDEDDEEEDYNDDEDDDEDNEDDDDDRVYLETANDLFDRLNDLPRKCKNFIVRFKDIDNGDWVQPERWYIDDDQDLILNIYDDGDDHHEFTVNDLMNILTGGTTDDNDNVVEEETPVYIDVNSDDDNYRRSLDEYFRINWKKKRVEIPVRDADEGYDEDDSYEDEAGDEVEDEDGDEEDDNNDSGNDIGDNLTLRLLLSNAIKDL